MMKDATPPLSPTAAHEAYEKATTPVEHKAPSTGRPQASRWSPTAVGHTFIGVGVLLLVVGVVFGAAIPPVVTHKIEDGVTVCSASAIAKPKFLDAYGDCKDCVPFYYSITLFNVTNALEHLETGAKLKVQELGPYAYRRRQIRTDVELQDGNQLVSYKMYTYHTFDPAKSCDGCSDKDEVVSWDVTYLNVMSAAGGELAYLRRVAKGSWGAARTDAEIDAVLRTNGTQMMRWINGLNSNQPTAWRKLRGTVLTFLALGPSAIASLDLSGFEFNGVFARRPVADYALGFPSLLAGLSVGSNYVKACNVTGGFNEKCASCQGDACLAIASECRRCTSGKKVLAINSVTCKMVQQRYAAVFGEKEAEEFVNETCNSLCQTNGLCAAPIGGAAETSGLDYSKQAPASTALNTYVQRTGCSDKNVIYDFVQYDGLKTQPYWATLESRRMPTLAEINAFQTYANCEKPLPNVTCSDIFGNDATSVKPEGAGVSGFPDKVTVSQMMIYQKNAKQNITLFNTGEVVDDIDGIPLTRFTPARDLLSLNEYTTKKGTAYPVDGVQPLAFNVGFLAFLSYPMYMFGDKSLTDNVEITMFDGQIASPETLLDASGQLKKPYYERFQTFVDVEPGTGKTMRAKQRLQASYALSKSAVDSTKPLSDVVWPSAPTEIISPAYIGEESAVVTPSRIDTFKSVDRLLGAVLPVLIVGIVLGVALIGGGFLYRRRALRSRKDALGDAV
ncbi:hypothetical protein P43SY_004750 [Pythium insidiosum]|uniref:Croquemort-like mating protein M82 n=1 Tax=Pythium insidiosum TaxID=114742 RepID=A0AAD5LWD9_PYTIN|nr:hypothetical protein P43SY_004750 [Pythium insidiosum]